MDIFISLLTVIWDVEVMGFLEGIFRGALKKKMQRYSGQMRQPVFLYPLLSKAMHLKAKHP